MTMDELVEAMGTEMRSIRECVEAGLYPKNDKGHALVPMVCGKTATIVAVAPYGSLLGWYMDGYAVGVHAWSERGIGENFLAMTSCLR